MLSLGKIELIEFVLVDTDGIEVPGLADTFSVEISKNGGVFAAGVGDKAEVSDGWYTYELTADETDTEGPLAVKITGVGIAQQNLVYEVSGSILEIGVGDHILTTAEAAAVLRCDEDDQNMLLLLPAIDAYIKMGTGHDWAADTTIREEAKNAARIALVQWHEDPGMTLSELRTLSLGFNACMTQLEAIALHYRTFEGLDGVGSIELPGVCRGDSIITLTGKVGISGDQSTKFESVITVDGTIQQTSSEDLYEKWFEVYIVSPGEMP